MKVLPFVRALAGAGVAVWTFAFAGASTLYAARSRLIFHVDLNVAQLKGATVSNLLERVAADGYNAILWEIEDKVRWENAPHVVDAFSKEEFRQLLRKAKSLGLEPIPLMQTFGHAEYVLYCPQYAFLRETAGSRDGCYCVSRPETRAFLKMLLHEYLELFGEDVKWFHLGGDEAHGFAKCTTCAKRHPMELYDEHLTAVAEELRTRGIRPCIWSDMVFGDKYADGAERISRDFMIWNWDYEVGSNQMCKWTHRLGRMKELGFDVVFAVAAASWGDGPFLPDMRYHRNNIEYGANAARTNALGGFCVTSWAVRQNPKRLQRPLVAFAAKRFLSPAADMMSDWRRALDASGVGMSSDELDALSGWKPRWQCYDARSKVPEPPKFDMWLEIKPKLGKGDLKDFAVGERRIAAALAKADGEWKVAGELQLELLKTMRLAVDDQEWPSPPIDRTVRFYGVEQSPLSAAVSAELVWGFWK